jgi:cyclophilin family peptidyl-prolyl cis-trans isomerase
MIVQSRPCAVRTNFRVEPLESRRLLHNVLLSEMPNQVLNLGESVTVNPAQYIDYEEINGTFLKMTTNFGPIYIEMFDDQTPITVANFLAYVNAGDYNNSIFHRLVPNFVLQGGVVKVVDPSATPDQIEFIESRGTIQNEFDPSRSNVARTLAMAKVGPPQGSPPTTETINSASSSFFFNLGDNSANLDNQNGGFTTFARVYDDASWDVVQAMNSLNAPGNFPQFPELPEDANGNLAVISNLSVLPENTFNVRSSNPNVLNASLVNGQVSLQAVGAGVATVTVTGSSPYDGSTLSDTFAVAINPTAAINPAEDAAPATITVGNADSKAVRFTDADGTVVTISSRAALASVEFIGDNVTFDSLRGVTTVSGTNVSIREITVTESTARSSVTLSGRGGDNMFAVGDVTGAGTLGTLTASNGVLSGDITMGGAIGKVTLLGISGGSISGATGEVPLTLTARGAVVDSTVNVPAASATIKATSWTNSDATTDSITADNIRTLTVTGDFTPNVTTTAGIRAATIRGAVAGSTWNVGSELTALTVGSWSTGSITAAAITKLTSIGAFGADVTTSGELKTATVRGNVSSAAWSVAGALSKLTVASWDNAGGNGTIAANSILAITSTGNFGPDITTSGGEVRVLTVRGTVTGGTWDVAAGTRPSKVTATDTGAGWIGVFAGAVSTFAVRNTLDGTLSAASIGTLSAGVLTAPVSVTSAVPGAFSLSTLKVGQMTDAEVRSAGDIRTVVVTRGALRSAIFAGLAAGEASADELGDFVNPTARIVTAKFAAARGQVAFSDSAIIAPVLGTVTLGAIADTAPTVPFFGAAFDTLSTLTFTLDGKSVRVRNAPDQGTVDAQLQAQGVTLTNMDIVAL